MAASIAQRDALQAKNAELERKLAARDVEMTELRASVMTRFRRSANFVMPLLRGPTPATAIGIDQPRKLCSWQLPSISRSPVCCTF